jgi:hypothetical protein
MEGLSLALKHNQENGLLSGIKVSRFLKILHLLFVDDILLMTSGAIAKWIEICRILKLFCKSSGLRINPHKTTFLHHGVTPTVLDSLKSFFPYNHRDISEGFRYLGFFLKFDRLKAADWLWLVEKYEKRITPWSSRWLSLGGRMVLIKVVIESQPVYWLTLTSLPSSIQTKLCQITYNFLWSRCR